MVTMKLLEKNEILAILEQSMTYMAERFERCPEYGFIDTKFNIVTGEEQGNLANFRGRSHVYAWIQGRGIESLAKHSAFFTENGAEVLASRLRKMLACVVRRLEECRRINGGRLPFVMAPDGTPLSEMAEPPNYSDLFYAKGLLAAGLQLGDEELVKEAKGYFRFVVENIADFRTDQKSFDPKNPVEYVPGKHLEGPRMIALSGLADFAAAFPEETSWQTIAQEFISHILTYHACLPGNLKNLPAFDFFEAVDDAKKPRLDGRVLICDPGHALEFCGLAARFLLVLKKLGQYLDLIGLYGEILPKLYLHIFELGFQRGPMGIIKAFDLLSRRPLNTDMPWWSLPETFRAGRELQVLYPEFETEIRPCLELCSEAFRLFRKGNGFACQTRDENGKIVPVIPALPDADPGYHTNLSLMDCLKLS